MIRVVVILEVILGGGALDGALGGALVYTGLCISAASLSR